MTASMPPLPSIPGYRVLERLGSGATSDVLLVEDVVPRRGVHEKVIAKVLSVQIADDDSLLIAFKREVEAYGKISSHPALVDLKRAIVTEDDLVVLVLEYVEGISLEKLLELLAPRQRLPDGVVLYVMERIFAALATAHGHAAGAVIHGEMRASNLLLGWNGSVKLADFGIRKILHDKGARVSVLRSPFSYVAPEEVRGETPTPASDVYAASLMIWELLTGFPPAHRSAETQEEIVYLLAHPNHPLLDELRPDLPRAVRQLVARGLAADPKDRKVSAVEIVEILNKHLPLERGKEKLAGILAEWRPAHVVIRERPPAPPAAAAARAEPIPDDRHASALRTLGGERGAPARRLPRTHRVSATPTEPLPATSAPPLPRAAVAPVPPAPPSHAAAPPVSAPRAPVPPARPPSWGKRVSIAVVALCALTVVVTRMRQTQPRPPVPLAPSAPLEAREPAPSTAPSARPALASSSSASRGTGPADALGRPVEDMGGLRADATAVEHRIYVDGKVVGEGPGLYRVKCGKRLIRIGSGDEEKELDVPCGGEVAISLSRR
jgi:eukaryotic-like serine/threonine-protein kinase